MYHPMVPELVQTSSFYFPTYEEFMAASIDEKIIMFTRGTNPTTEILEKKLLVWNVEKNVKFCLRNGRYFGNAVYVAPTR